MKIIGILLIIESIFMLVCLIPSAYYSDNLITHLQLFNPEHDFLPILFCAAIAGLTGLFLWIKNGRLNNESVGKREGYIIVTSAWIIISIFGALPYYFSSTTTCYTDAFFETMSGFTTTGATILIDIEGVAKGLLFWRALTHWIGGMGIIVLTLAILPILGIGGMQLFIAEVPALTPDKLHPRIAKTAKKLWQIYVLLTVVQTILLMLGGLNLFDALCHAFATMATGGFSTFNDSVASFTPYLQYVIIVFMFLAGTSFTIHYLVLTGKFDRVKINDEFKYYFLIVLAASLVIALSLIISQNRDIEESIRTALFQVVSIITTTGFITDDYLLWPQVSWFIILLLMFVGGSSGSTGGGVKVVRILILVKNSFLELKRLLHPHAIISVRLNKRPLSQNIVFNVLAFFLLYIFIFAIGTLIMTMLDMSFETAIGSVATSLGNIGPGFGTVGPVSNFALINPIAKWFLSFFMLLGRLELFTVLILFSPFFWKK